MEAFHHKISLKLTHNRLVEFQKNFPGLKISVIFGLNLAPIIPKDDGEAQAKVEDQEAQLKILQNQIDTWLDKSDENLEFLEMNKILVASCDLKEYSEGFKDDHDHNESLEKYDEPFEIEFKMNNDIKIEYQPFVKFESRAVDVEVDDVLCSSEMTGQNGVMSF